MSPVKSEKGHNLFVFLCFLFVSFCLWLLKALDEKFETDIVVDVVVMNIPEGLELEEDVVGVEVFVRDEGTKLVGYMFGANPQTNIDFKDLTDIDGNLTMHVSTLENRVSNSLKPSSTFLHFKDDYISFKVKRERKELPLKVNHDIETARNYELDAVVPSVPSVVVTAPPSRIKALEELQLPELVLRGVRRDTVCTISFQEEKYVDYEPAQVDLLVSVLPYVKKRILCQVGIMNKPLDVELNGYYDVPDSVIVTYTAPASVAGDITVNDFGVGADFMELSDAKSDSVAFRIVRAPASVDKRDIKIVPEYVYRKNAAH